MYSRKGALFMDYIRRVEIVSDNQFRQTVFYIHKNPVYHGIVQKMNDWKWSSFNNFLEQGKEILLSSLTLEFFDGLEGFQRFHSQPIELKINAPE